MKDIVGLNNIFTVPSIGDSVTDSSGKNIGTCEAILNTRNNKTIYYIDDGNISARFDESVFESRKLKVLKTGFFK